MGLLLHLCLAFYLKTQEHVLSQNFLMANTTFLRAVYSLQNVPPHGEFFKSWIRSKWNPTLGGMTLILNNKNQYYDFTSNTHLPPITCGMLLYFFLFCSSLYLWSIFFMYWPSFISVCVRHLEPRAKCTVFQRMWRCILIFGNKLNIMMSERNTSVFAFHFFCCLK